MARRYISLLVTGGLVLLTLAGCGQRDSPDVPPTAGPSDIRAIEKGDEYVAIGDSYTAAPGLGPSTNACAQSTMNYPHTVAAKLGLKLIDVSCGGATTTHVTRPQTIGSIRRPPQADALSRRTDLVTISLGANDFNAFGLVAFGCVAVRFQDLQGAPCQKADAASASTIESMIQVTEDRLIKAIRWVAERAPSARILVIGYPEIFPESGPCAQLPLAAGDYAFARRVNELLVRAQVRASTQRNVEYVDVFAASRGHDMCAQDPWIAGLYPKRPGASPLHPYPEEQQFVAGLLLDLLT